MPWPFEIPVLRLLGVLAAVGMGLLMGAGTAYAQDDFQDFRRAQEAYQNQEYGAAATQLEALVGGATPRIGEGPLRLESRKYLAASYLFLGRRPDAEAQFTLLLNEDPEHQLDPLAFSNAVVRVFSEIQERVAEERASQSQQQAEENLRRLREERERREREEERIRMLEAVAAEETVEQTNSRWIASIPFGPGQFQNGDDVLGTTFLVGGIVLVGASIVTAVLHASVSNQLDSGMFDPVEGVAQANSLRIFNWVSFSALAAIGVASVIEAHISFEPFERTTRTRPLAPELWREPDLPEDEVDVEVSVSPTSLQLLF